jgi:DNA-directed RNA polymerase specialized sigma24 family protein
MMSYEKLSELNDSDLTREVLHGTTLAWDVLFQRKEPMLHEFLLHLLRDEYKTEEKDQETWIKFWHYCRSHPEAEIRNVDTFIRTIAFQLAFARPAKKQLDYVPLNGSEKYIGDPVPDELAMLCEMQERQLLEEHMNKLPQRRQMIVRMRLKGHSFPAIEKALGLKKNSASSAFWKGIRQLLQSFGITECPENLF